MAVTFTIKQVPDELAEMLRRRAEANRRSLQRELLYIIETAALDGVREPLPAYAVKTTRKPAARRRREKGITGKLTLEELWARARRLGAPMPSESAEIVRHDRDAGQRR